MTEKELPKALGRKVEHDPRSWDYPIVRRAAPQTSVQHPTFGEVLNQGSIGACTGFAGMHAMNTWPFRTVASNHRLFTNQDGLDLYSEATRRDVWDGEWPPDDTGSSGLAVMKALKDRGLIKQYRWAFSVADILGVIQFGPLLVGTEWHNNMFYPDKNGLVVPKGGAVGGHEYVLSGYQITNKTLIGNNLFWFRNSWGIRWGKIGGFCMTVKNFEKLLGNRGDAVRPLL